MSCDCDFDSAPKTCTMELRTARKEHRCNECYCMAIRPGEQYEHVWGVWDDGPRVFKTCRRCLNLRQFMEKHAHCFCWTFGDVRSAAREEAHEWRGDTGGDLFALGRLEVAILRARKFYAIQRHIVVPAQ